MKPPVASGMFEDLQRLQLRGETQGHGQKKTLLLFEAGYLNSKANRMIRRAYGRRLLSIGTSMPITRNMARLGSGMLKTAMKLEPLLLLN